MSSPENFVIENGVLNEYLGDEEELKCVNYDGTVGPAVQECGLPF